MDQQSGVNFTEQVQDYVTALFTDEGITPYFYGNELHMREMVALNGGLVKLFQQALLIDVTRQTNCVWDNGFFIEPNEESMTGLEISIEEPKPNSSKFPIWGMLVDSVNTGVRLTEEPNAIEISNFPVRPVPSYLRNMEVRMDWDYILPLLAQKEAEYRSGQFKPSDQSQLQ
jgi:hypothetical protein